MAKQKWLVYGNDEPRQVLVQGRASGRQRSFVVTDDRGFTLTVRDTDLAGSEYDAWNLMIERKEGQITKLKREIGRCRKKGWRAYVEGR